MDDFTARLNYVNEKIDEVYEDIKKNYGYKAELEGALKASAFSRKILSLLELLVILGMAGVMLKAFVCKDSMYIMMKYIVPGLLVLVIFSGSIHKYSDMEACLEKVKHREARLEEILNIFKDDRQALLSGERMLIHNYSPLEPLKLPAKTSGVISTMLTIAVAATCLFGLSRLDYDAFKPALSSMPFVSSGDGISEENEAGAVSNAEGADGDSENKAVTIPGSYSQAALNGEEINLSFKWKYDFATWTQTMSVSRKSYEYYKNKNRSIVDTDYKRYIEDTDDDEVIKALADGMSKTGADNGYDEYKQLELIISFVQGLEYIPDEDEDGNEIEYPKYPLETLVDGGGDCEDTAILLASLLRAKGYGVALICMPEHIAVGIKGDAVEGVGSYYEYAGSKYYYIETTAQNWPIGEIPDDYKGKEVELVVIQ